MARNRRHRKPSHIDEAARERSCDGVRLVMLAFSVAFLWGGMFKFWGVLLPTMRDQFATQTWLIGLVITIMAATADIAGVFTTVLENIVNTQRLLTISLLMVSVGFLLVPLSTRIEHVAIILACIVGPGIGIAVVIYKAILGRYFNCYYTIACSIGHSGNGVALLVVAPMTQLLLDTYGWKGATLIFGAICLHPVAFSFISLNSEYQSLPKHDNNQTQSDTSGSPAIKLFLARIVKVIDLELFCEFDFLVLFSCFAGIRFVTSSWVVFFVPHLEAKGISPLVSVWLTTAAGVGYFVGTLALTPLLARVLKNYSTCIIVTSIAVSLSLVVDPWVDSVVGLAVISVLFGLFSASQFIFVDVYAKDLFGSERLTSVFGWMGTLGGIFRLLSGFLPGWIYDTYGDYNLAFILIGAAPTVALMPLVIGKVIKRLKN